MTSVRRMLDGVGPSAMALALVLMLGAGACATSRSELPMEDDQDAGVQLTEQPKRDGGSPRDAAPQPDSASQAAQPDSGQAPQPDAAIPRDAAPQADAAPQPDATVVAGCTQLPATGTIMMNGATTVASPTWARPLATTCPATGTSSFGTAVARALHVFCNDTGAAKSYSIQMDGLDESAALTHPDPYLIVYAGTTLPADPLMCAIGNDDRAATSAGAGLVHQVAAGGRIVVVASGFENTDLGTYTLRITAQ